MTRKSSSKVTTTKTKTSSPKRTTKRRTSSTKSASKTVIVEKKVTPTVKPVSVTKPVVNTTKKVTTTKKPVRVTKPVEIAPKKVTTVSTTKSASKPVIVEKKVAPTPKTVVEAKPELIKPEVELISFDSYVQDIKNRIAIHNYEFALFVKDCRFGVNFVTNYLQDSYKKQFNL